MRHGKKDTVGVWLDRSRTMPDPSDQDPHSACLRSYKCLWRRPMVDSTPVLDSPILSLYFMVSPRSFYNAFNGELIIVA
jgi:hypothetical protein